MVRPRDDRERDADRCRGGADVRTDRARNVLRRRDRRPAGFPSHERAGRRRQRRHHRRHPAALRDGRDRVVAGHGPRLPRRAVRRARHDGPPLAPPRPRGPQRDEARACDRDQQCDPARLAARRRSDRGDPRQRDRRDQRSLAERRDVRDLGAARLASRPRVGAAPRRARARPLSLRVAHWSSLRRARPADPDDRADRLPHELPRRTVPGHLPGVRDGGVRECRVPRHHARRLRGRGAGRLAGLQRRRASTAAPPDVRLLVPARGVALHGARAASVAPGHAGPDGRVGACLGAAEPRAPDRRLRARPGPHAWARLRRDDRGGVPGDPRRRGARWSGRRALRRRGHAVRDRRLLPRRDAHGSLQHDPRADGPGAEPEPAPA